MPTGTHPGLEKRETWGTHSYVISLPKKEGWLWAGDKGHPPALPGKVKQLLDVAELIRERDRAQCREQARRVYYGAVFEAKKEIPD
jgi:hypothetical protein